MQGEHYRNAYARVLQPHADTTDKKRKGAHRTQKPTYHIQGKRNRQGKRQITKHMNRRLSLALAIKLPAHARHVAGTYA